MLVRAVGPTEQTRSGFVWVDGEFRVVDGFDMTNHYAGAPAPRVAADRGHGRAPVTVEWSAVGDPQNYLPLRHRQRNDAGDEATLRIVKQPAEWEFADGRTATGHLEYHDLLERRRPGRACMS